MNLGSMKYKKDSAVSLAALSKTSSRLTKPVTLLGGVTQYIDVLVSALACVSIWSNLHAVGRPLGKLFPDMRTYVPPDIGPDDGVAPVRRTSVYWKCRVDEAVTSFSLEMVTVTAPTM